MPGYDICNLIEAFILLVRLPMIALITAVFCGIETFTARFDGDGFRRNPASPFFIDFCGILRNADFIIFH